MKSLNIWLAGLGSAVAGFVLQGCFAAQPAPECGVLTGAPVLGVGNYQAVLTKTAATGTGCDDVELKELTVGMMRFSPPGQPNVTIDVRPSRVVDIKEGHVFSADIDAENNCAESPKGADCALCTLPTGGGNYVLPDGGPVTPTALDDGGTKYTVPDGDGGTLDVSSTNTCDVPQDDPVERKDPSDEEGMNLTMHGKLTKYPDAEGVCRATDLTPSTQSFESVTMLDGGVIPALAAQVEFTNVEIVNTTKAPGTYWTAKMKQTEGACTIDYDVVGFYPQIHCGVKDENKVTQADDSICEPSADLDAGRVTGSGISPSFKPKCHPELFVCVPTVTAADLK